MGTTASVSKTTTTSKPAATEPQLNEETSISRFNGLKLILSCEGSMKAFGQFMCTEKVPPSWSQFMVSISEMSCCAFTNSI